MTRRQTRRFVVTADHALSGECAANIDALLWRLLETPYTAEWWEANHALARLGHRIIPDLIEVVECGTPFAAAAAARILGEVGPGACAAESALLRVLDHTDACVRSAAAHALARINPRLKQAAPFIVERFAAEDNPAARRGLLRVVANIGPAAADAVPHVSEALAEDDLFEDAVYALQSLTRGELPTLADLMDWLQNGSDRVRRAAARALARLDDSDGQVRAALLAAAQGSDWMLQLEAERLLRKIDRRQS